MRKYFIPFAIFLVITFVLVIYKPHLPQVVTVGESQKQELISTTHAKSEFRNISINPHTIYEKNLGQWPQAIKFGTNVPGAKLFFTNDEIISVILPSDYYKEIQVSRSDEMESPKTEAFEIIPNVVRIQFPNAYKGSVLVGGKGLTGKVNYFKGNKPSKWITNIPTYSELNRSSLYEGIDIVYRGSNGHFEFDLYIEAGADIKQFQMLFDGVENINLNKSGNLILKVDGQDIIMKQPNAIQAGEPIDVRYEILSNNLVTIAVDDYDKLISLYIDPVISYSTYFGGSSWDTSGGIAVDALENIYITGSTGSIDFPTSSPYQATLGRFADAFVTKLNPSGSAIIYSTYIGGASGEDYGFAIALDSADNVYLTGRTSSFDFPTMNPFQASISVGGGAGGWPFGFTDAFVTKLNSNGSSLIYSTYLGGTGNESGYGIAVDSSGSAHVTGFTNSVGTELIADGFPLRNPVQPSFGGAYDAFSTRFDSSGTSLIYSTYLGGWTHDRGNDIATDSAGNSYVIGTTFSDDYPTTVNPFQQILLGWEDFFLTRIDSNPSMATMEFSTFFGGSAGDSGEGIFVDASDNIFLVGRSGSNDFPTLNPLQGVNSGGWDATVSKMNRSGSALIYSTYIGGTGADSAREIVVDSLGYAYISGWTNSIDFPTFDPVQSSLAGTSNRYDVFVVKLLPSGSAFSFSTYLGGSWDESVSSGSGNNKPTHIAINSANKIYVSGYTLSFDFPTVNPIQPMNAGSADVFITIIDDSLLCGDCNGDGVVSILDALIAAQHAAGLYTITGDDFTRCNVTGLLEPDPAAVVDILDALFIARYSAGFPTSLVCL